MTMDQRPESSPAAPEPSDRSAASSDLDALIGATLREQAERVSPDPVAAARLAARLDATPLDRRRWRPPPRAFAAFAVALAVLIVVVVTPVGRFAASGVHDVTQAIVTTMRDFATGGGEAVATKTGPGTRAVPSGASGSPSAPSAPSGIGSPGAQGTATNGSAIAPPTPLGGSPGAQGTVGRTDSAGTGTPTRAGTAIPATTPGATTVPTSTATATPTRTVTETPTRAGQGTGTAAIPPTALSPTPASPRSSGPPDAAPPSRVAATTAPGITPTASP